MKEKSFKTNDFQLKFFLFFILIIFLIEAPTFYFFYEKFRTEKISNFRERIQHQINHANLIASNEISASDSLSFLFLDYVFTQNHDFIYYTITDSGGKIIAGYNTERAIEKDFMVAGTEIKDFSSRIVKLRDKIQLMNNKNYPIFLGYATDSIKYELEKSKSEMALFGGAVLMFAVVIGVFITASRSRKTKDVLNKIKTIIDKNPSLQLNIKEDTKKIDELIAIEYLDVIKNELAELSDKYSKLNQKYTRAFSDKLDELSLEINQRKITEQSLKESEKQFRTLFEKAPVGMFLSSIENDILEVNDSFADMLGYKKEDLISKNVKDISQKENWLIEEKLYEKLVHNTPPTLLDDKQINIEDQTQKDFLQQQLVKENLTEINIEKKFLEKNNTEVFTISKVILLKDEKGKPKQFVNQVIDITERKQIENELIVAKEKAEESDKLKSAFLAQMSHEIRTPLNVILNATPLLVDDEEKQDPETAELFDGVVAAGKRLNRTINLILSMSSVQSGSYEPTYSVMDLNNILKNLTDEFKSMCKEKGLNFSFNSFEEKPLVNVDEYTINQVFQNLIDNAIKYTREGEVSIRIVSPETEKDKIHVEVEDTGIGIAKEYQENIFSPFSQEDVGQKREFEGNGLGLALVNKYVELNNADIYLESEKNVGSTFIVVFSRYNNN